MGKRWPVALFFLMGGYVLTLHALFLIRIADPLIHPDTLSYLTPALDLLVYHSWTLDPSRTAGYPIFLYALLAMSGGFKGILIIQHFLVLATALAAAGISFLCFDRSWGRAALVAFLTALSPEATMASHALLTDTLYAAFVIGSTFVFLLLSRAAKQTARSWILLGMTVGISILIRPVGYALALALGLMGFLTGRTRRLNLVFIGSIAAVLLSYSAFNYAHFRFFGVTQITGPRLFGMAARYIDVSRIEDPRLRDALAPIYAHHAERMDDAVWVRAAPEGPMQAVSRLYPTSDEANQILQKLSRQALVEHPFAFAGLQAELLVRFFTQTFVPPAIYWQPDYRFFLYRGLDLARSLQIRYPIILRWLSQPPELGRRTIEAFQRILRLPAAEGQRQMDRLYAESPYGYDSVCRMWEPFAPWFRCYGWLAIGALFLGFWRLRQPEKRFPASCLLSVILIHAVMINLGGDSVGRYAIPLEPLIWILLVS